MRLIGMLDSPYVRRVAISLRLMELPFAHAALSVFRNWTDFAAINPVVKAPTLVTGDGTVLMDSGLILEYAERLVPAERRLTPGGLDAHARAPPAEHGFARRRARPYLAAVRRKHDGGQDRAGFVGAVRRPSRRRHCRSICIMLNS